MESRRIPLGAAAASSTSPSDVSHHLNPDLRSPTAAHSNANKSNSHNRHANFNNAFSQHSNFQDEDLQKLQNDEMQDSANASGAAGDNTVVHKDRNGTITVQSTKTVGKSNYSFVSVSPT